MQSSYQIRGFKASTALVRYLIEISISPALHPQIWAARETQATFARRTKEIRPRNSMQNFHWLDRQGLFA